MLGRIMILSDSAHSFGASYKERKTGSLADVSVFSFHAVKNLTTAEGGAVALNLPDPFNNQEPVDSSAAAIGAQGLLRLGYYLQEAGQAKAGDRYWQAGLTVLQTLFREPYLSTDPAHQGLLLHSVYHWPNGWDYVPAGSTIPYGESSMWGDYHIREVALYLQKIINQEPYYNFFNCVK